MDQLGMSRRAGHRVALTAWHLVFRMGQHAGALKGRFNIAKGSQKMSIGVLWKCQMLLWERLDTARRLVLAVHLRCLFKNSVPDPTTGMAFRARVLKPEGSMWLQSIHVGFTRGYHIRTLRSMYILHGCMESLGNQEYMDPWGCVIRDCPDRLESNLCVLVNWVFPAKPDSSCESLQIGQLGSPQTGLTFMP